MKKIKVFFFFFSFLIISGCTKSLLNQSDANKIEMMLKEKYGEDFKVYSIGGRQPFNPNSSVKAYCYSINNPNAKFEVTLDNVNDVINDGYPESIISSFAAKRIQKVFDESEIKATVKGDIYLAKFEKIIKEDELDELIENTEDIVVSADIMVTNIDDYEKLYNASIIALNKFQKNGNLLKVLNIINLRESDYNSYLSEFVETPFFSTKEFQNYGVLLGNSYVRIENNIILTDFEQFKEEIFKNHN